MRPLLSYQKPLTASRNSIANLSGTGQADWPIQLSQVSRERVGPLHSLVAFSTPTVALAILLILLLFKVLLYLWNLAFEFFLTLFPELPRCWVGWGGVAVISIVANDGSDDKKSHYTTNDCPCDFSRPPKRAPDGSCNTIHVKPPKTEFRAKKQERRTRPLQQPPRRGTSKQYRPTLHTERGPSTAFDVQEPEGSGSRFCWKQILDATRHSNCKLEDCATSSVPWNRLIEVVQRITAESGQL